jgi:cellulose synthase/poly-beta-1,6-N-acetylglucosamine synthase-like glycosyltransferase
MIETLMFQVIIEYVALAAALFYFHLNYLIMIVSFAALKKSGAAKKYPRVSCIIATKHEENVLEETLRALRKSDYPSKIEIIVVDGSADNKTRAIAKKYADKIIADRRGTGKAYALNLGLKAARGEVIYILDADCVVERSTLKRLVSGLKEGYVACQGFIIPNKGGFAARAFRLEVSYLNMLQAWLHNMTKSSTLQGRNYVIYRKTLAEMGGYSPGVLTEEIEALQARQENEPGA